MDAPRPQFIWFMVVIVTIVFAVLYNSLPETFEAVHAGRPGRFDLRREPKFLGKQVDQRPLLIGVWLMIVVPLAAWGVVVTRRASQ